MMVVSVALIGIFALPFIVLICAFIINFHNSEQKTFNFKTFIFLISIISIAFHYSKYFIYMKEFFSSIIKSRIASTVCLCPILYFELNYNITKNFYSSNIHLFRIPINYIIQIFYISFIILIVLFDNFTDNYFLVHTPFNYSITVLIYILFIIMFIVSEYIIKFNLENNIVKKNLELVKIILFLFEFFINDVPNTIMILIIYIIYEYLFEAFYNKEQKKINKLLISIIIININELFYFLVSRVYSLETTKLFFSKTLTYHIVIFGKFYYFLEIFTKIKFQIILVGYLLESYLIGNKLFNNQESFILRTMLNIKCCFNFIFFSYEIIYLKNDENYMTLFIYSIVDVSVYIFDFVNQFLIYLNYKIIRFIIKK